MRRSLDDVQEVAITSRVRHEVATRLRLHSVAQRAHAHDEASRCSRVEVEEFCERQTLQAVDRAAMSVEY